MGSAGASGAAGVGQQKRVMAGGFEVEWKDVEGVHDGVDRCLPGRPALTVC